MDFYITLSKNEYGYTISCPTLKGCHSQGKTEEEAIDNIKDAIIEYLQTLKETQSDKNTKIIKIEVPL